MLIIFWPRRMHSIDAAYCDRCHTYCGLCVCALVTLMDRAKMAAPIEMPFGILTVMGQGTMY